MRVEGVGATSIQGDVASPTCSRAWAPRSRCGEDWIEARGGATACAASTIDCTTIPDAAMTLAVLALFADGPTHAAQHRAAGA